jgi:putative transcriptional regulator
MRDELFDELVASVREGGRILRGEEPPAREHHHREPDVAALRERYGLSQEKFAALLGISVRTLQNWEQGRRRPHGPARVLLRVAEEHPEAILETLRKAG